MKSEKEFLEESRNDLLYMRKYANLNSKISIQIAFIGLIVFIGMSLSGLFGLDLIILTKVMSLITGLIISVFLFISLYFTFCFSYSYVKLKKSISVLISGFILFCIIPFLGLLLLLAIPLWSKFITNKFNKLFVSRGLKPLFVPEDLV